MAGPNKTDPSILGMVGLSLHLGKEVAARDYERRTMKAIEGGAREYSLVSNTFTVNKGVFTLPVDMPFLTLTAWHN